MRFFIQATLCLALVLTSTALADEALAQDAPDPDANLLLTVAVNRPDAYELVTIDIAGKNEHSLLREPKGVTEPTWSPDGRRLAFVLFPAGPGQIYVMNADGSGLKNITNTQTHERSPVWSPDGKRIAFTSNRTGNQEVFAINPDGTQAVNLSNHPGYDADAAWSPDGKLIAFASSRDNRPFRMFSMKADGSEQQDLFKKDFYGWMYPAWSVDGKQLLYGGTDDGETVQLFVSNLDGQGTQKLTNAATLNSFASWSPDGRYVAYVQKNNFDSPFLPSDAPRAGQVGDDLMLYDVVASTHSRLLAGVLQPWGPRPAWKPLPAEAEVIHGKVPSDQ